MGEYTVCQEKSVLQNSKKTIVFSSALVNLLTGHPARGVAVRRGIHRHVSGDSREKRKIFRFYTGSFREKWRRDYRTFGYARGVPFNIIMPLLSQVMNGFVLSADDVAIPLIIVGEFTSFTSIIHGS
jgi:hypothetical protein